MQRVFHSLLVHHDIRLVLLAAVVCAFGAVCTLSVSKRVAGNRRGWLWLIALSVCAGATVWATHFIAMLAYLGYVPITYRPGLTTLSFASGALVMGTGFSIAIHRRERSYRLLGGGTVGLGVVVLHYIGMAAMRVPGQIAWAPELVVASVVLSMGFGAAALLTAFAPDRVHARLTGALLFCLMVVSLHFTAMGALSIDLFSLDANVADGLPRSGLATAVAIASLFVLLIGLASALVDERVSHQAAQSVARLRASEARFRAIFDHAALGITVIDSSTGELHDFNPAFCNLLGYEADELRGRIAASFSPPEDAAITREPVQNLRRGVRDSITVEKRFVRKDGQFIWGNLTVSRVDDGIEERKVLVGMLEDITERKAMEAELMHQAFHDRLTGLANRALFHDRVEHALARATSAWLRGKGAPGPEAHYGIVVMFVDLDGFKHVNDSLGHAAGDRLLVTIGGRIAGCLRGIDTVARLGGDEFAILLEDSVDPEHAVAIAERVLSTLRIPIMLEDRQVVVTASIGIAHVRPGDDTEALLRSADAAMYAAKANGKGQYAIYDPDMHRRALERLQLEADLRLALENAEFELHYQPLVNLATQSIYGAEALIRWRHQTLGLISPAQFIPIAEETGIIVEIGEWVLNEACRQAMEWRAMAFGSDLESPFLMSVNISGRQLQDGGLVEQVAAALTAARMPPSALVLEITESVVMQKVEFAYERLVELKKLGVALAIDDFGTGYSSLSQLKQFPFDSLKIDKSFVDGISSGLLETTPGSVRDTALVRTIVALGQSLGLRVVAEGIEVNEQIATLHALGCECGQGYYYARPLPPDEFVEEMRARRARAITAAA